MAIAQLDVRRRQVDEVVRAVGRCRAIDVGPEPLEMFEEITRVVLRALEHQVLEQVGEAALVSFFVLGTDVIPEIYGHDREVSGWRRR